MNDLMIFNKKEDLLSWACNLYDSIDSVALEFGVYTGYSISIIRKNFRGRVYGFDSFNGLPEKWRDGFEKGYFKTNSIPSIEGVSIVVGLFQDTLEEFLKNLKHKIKLVHFDADLYSSTIFCLEKITDYLSDDCVFIFDEYQNYPGHENHESKAFIEWLNNNKQFSSLKIAEVENDEQVAFSIKRI